MKFVFLSLFLMLVFGKVRALQTSFGFGGEMVNMPPKILLMLVLVGCFLRAFHGRPLIRLFKVEKWMFIFFGLFVLCGSVSSILSSYRTNLYPQIMDVFNYSSFILAFYGTVCFFQDTPKEVLNSWLSPTKTFTKALTIITLVFWFIEQVYGLGLTSPDISNRLLPPYEFIYYHGTYLITIIAFSFLLLYEDSKWYIFILCLLCVLSARDRGYLFLMLFLSFTALAKYNKLNLKFLLVLMGIVGIAGGAISFQKIMFYTGEETIRASFYVVAALLALKFFPFGSGWCTIGSWNSFRYHSAVYSDYYAYFVWAEDVESVYGDSGFSSVIGQAGVLGTFFYTGFMLLLFLSMLQRFKSHKKLCAVVCSWVVLSIISYFISDSMVSNFAIISGFFIAALYLAYEKAKGDSLLIQTKSVQESESTNE